ncbi:MAG: hypothetical protein IPM54_41265 [Polyangiaceae bacterium]|nr:hypothetical protein [Polyangiaceae bacterium]
MNFWLAFAAEHSLGLPWMSSFEQPDKRVTIDARNPACYGFSRTCYEQAQNGAGYRARAGGGPQPQAQHDKSPRRALGMSIKAYILHVVDQFAAQAKQELAADPSRKPFEGSRRQKRISIDIPPENARQIREAAAEFKTVREFILRCVEIEMRGQ